MNVYYLFWITEVCKKGKQICKHTTKQRQKHVKEEEWMSKNDKKWLNIYSFRQIYFGNYWYLSMNSPNPRVTADDLSNTDKVPVTCRCLHAALTKHNTHYWQSHFTPGTKLERHCIVQIMLYFKHPHIFHSDVPVNVVISFNYGLIKHHLVIFIININLAWITATIN